MKKPNGVSMCIVLVLLITAVLLAEGWKDAVFVIAVTLCFVLALGCGMKAAFGPVLSIWPFFFFILLLNSVFGQTMQGDNTVLWSWWIFTVTAEGIMDGVSVVFRCILISVVASGYIAVSNPLEMTDSLSRILSPLGWIGIPIEKFSFIMSMSLFFIPELKDESERILRAQRARGAVYGGDGLMEKARSYIPMIIPLFVSSLRRADEMSRALVSRGYNGERRKKRKPLRWSIMDIAVLAAAILVTVTVKGVLK